MASDPPPAYSTIGASTTNIAIVGEEATNCDDGSELLINNTFEDKTARLGFIQKVLTIKLLQLLMIAIIWTIFDVNVPSVLSFMYRGNNRVHVIVISILLLIASVWIQVKICASQNRQQNPLRYLFVLVHPLSITFVITFLTIFWDFLTPILVAWLTYIIAVFALLVYSIFALQTKLEFVARNAVVLAVFVQIVAFAIAVPVFYIYDVFSVLYITITLGVEIAYVIWDLEIMTSKSYWRHITPDDFLDGVLNLHIDYYYFVVKYLYPKVMDVFQMRETLDV